MKKFVKTLLVTMFALPLAACGEDEPVNPPVDWSKYLKPQGGAVTVDNSGEIDFINLANEQLPDGYRIITLSETTVSEDGVYNVTYAIVDEAGNVVYQTTVTYNVTLDYYGAQCDINYKGRSHDNGNIIADVSTTGYVWASQGNGYLTLKQGNDYSSYVVHYEEIIEGINEFISNLFNDENNVDPEPVLSSAYLPSRALDVDWSVLFELLKPLIEKLVSVLSKYMSNLYTITDNLSDLTRTIVFDTMVLSELVDELAKPLVIYNLITQEELDNAINYIKNMDFAVTLGGYDLVDDELEGNPNSIKAVIDLFMESYGLYGRITLDGSLDSEPEDPSKFMTLNGSFELGLLINKGTESEMYAGLIRYDAIGDITNNNGEKLLSIDLIESSPTDETISHLIGTVSASYVFDLEKDILFDINNVEVNYRDWTHSYYLSIDAIHANYEFVKCTHESTPVHCHFYDPNLDNADTCIEFIRFAADLSFAEPEISFFEKTEAVKFEFTLDLEGLSFYYLDLSNHNYYEVETDFEGRVIDFTIKFDYFELVKDEQTYRYYGSEINVTLTYVELPQKVIESAKSAKGFDYFISLASFYLSF